MPMLKYARDAAEKWTSFDKVETSVTKPHTHQAVHSIAWTLVAKTSWALLIEWNKQTKKRKNSDPYNSKSLLQHEQTTQTKHKCSR